MRCHQVQGQGGVVGPPLDDIAKRKDAAYIRESLIDPQAAMAEGYPAQVSPMPPFGVLLPPQDVEDLIAYLMTLQTDPLRVHAWLLKPFSLSRDAERMGRLVDQMIVAKTAAVPLLDEGLHGLKP